ncbi:hypothetical protein [Latilactobacillus sakei]|uniref:hypothetical protein n=1 Tax=Latilactobacillus sakei TaxID=1599 RepID=UPI001CFBDFA4|nr:hypothetical protein [Latilactobacillus sakei]MCB4409178.1 hypothetical protein [Latilactobacillus sakei]
MRILKIVIDGKKVDFGTHVLVYSDQNSFGKTTFLRLILFSLGWNIPSTKGIDFKKVHTEILFENNGTLFEFERLDNNLTVIKNKKIEEHFDLKFDLESVLSIMTGISNPQLLENILGTIYFDQEKGWTLLNRGIVIGSIRFTIETFLEGLSGMNFIDLREKIKRNEKELAGYQLLLKNLNHKEETTKEEETMDWTIYDNLNEALRTQNIDISLIEKQMKSLESAKRDNKKFLKMITSFGLRVKSGSEEIVVSDENIVGFQQNQSLLNARIAILRRDYNSMLKNKIEIEEKLKQQDKLFSLDSQLDRFNQSVSDLNISASSVESIIKDLRSEKQLMKKKITKDIMASNLSLELYELIVKFATFLNVDSYLKDNPNFIFTSDLKKYSGAVLHLLVYSFRLAYLYLLQKYTGNLYPIIIDSPFGKEVTGENVMLMYKMLDKYFPDNQVITASIEDISTFTTIDNKLKFEKTMMESIF